MRLNKRIHELEKYLLATTNHSHFWLSRQEYKKWVETTGGCDCKKPHIFLFTKYDRQTGEYSFENTQTKEINGKKANGHTNKVVWKI